MKILNKFILLLFLFNLTSCFEERSKKKSSNSPTNTSSNPLNTGIKYKNLYGEIDTSFGNNGVVLHDNAAFGGSGFDSAYSVKLTSTGDILLCGISYNGNDQDIAIWKYNTKGLLDENFGQGGVITRHNTAGGNEKDYCQDLVINNDDSFYLTGYSYNGSDDDMILVKYKNNGAPDYNFGNSGVIYHNYATGGSFSDNGKNIFTNSKNEILIVGSSPGADNNNDAVIWKYLPNGSRDTTFGTDGILNINTSANKDFPTTVNDSKILNNDKIVTIGNVSNVGNKGFLARVNPSGLMDPSFGDNGWIAYPDDVGGTKSICHTTNDYVLYTSYSDGVNHSKIYKMKSDGNLDDTFGENGVAFLADNTDIRACLRNDLGDIYVIANNNNSIQIYKFSENGVPDLTFGEDGVFTYQVGSDGIGSVNSVSFAIDGSILVSGWTTIVENEKQMFMIKVD